MDTLPFLFFLGLLFLVMLGSVSNKKGRRKSSGRLPSSRHSLRDRDTWVCPSCLELVEGTSDTCPWCGWTDLPSEDTAPTGRNARVEEGWVSEPIPEPDGISFLEPIPEPDEVRASSDVEVHEPSPGALEAEEPGEPVEYSINEPPQGRQADPQFEGEVNPPSDEGPSLAEAVHAILSEGIIGGKRDRLVKSLLGKDYGFELTVKKVERPISMFTDPDFRNGRIVSGVFLGSDVEVSVLYPNILNDEVDAFKPGASYSVRGVVADWDPLRLRPIVRARGMAR